jgi:hypothetical protein
MLSNTFHCFKVFEDLAIPLPVNSSVFYYQELNNLNVGRGVG